MINAATASIFLQKKRRIARAAITVIYSGIEKYAAKPEANQQWAKERFLTLEDISLYLEALEELVVLQNKELSKRYNEGFSAGYKAAPKQEISFSQPVPIGHSAAELLELIRTNQAR